MGMGARKFCVIKIGMTGTNGVSLVPETRVINWVIHSQEDKYFIQKVFCWIKPPKQSWHKNNQLKVSIDLFCSVKKNSNILGFFVCAGLGMMRG